MALRATVHWCTPARYNIGPSANGEVFFNCIFKELVLCNRANKGLKMHRVWTGDDWQAKLLSVVHLLFGFPVLSLSQQTKPYKHFCCTTPAGVVPLCEAKDEVGDEGWTLPPAGQWSCSQPGSVGWKAEALLQVVTSTISNPPPAPQLQPAQYACAGPRQASRYETRRVPMNLKVADNLQQISSRELGQGRTKGGLKEGFRQHPLWHSVAIFPQLMTKLLWQSLKSLEWSTDKDSTDD